MCQRPSSPLARPVRRQPGGLVGARAAGWSSSAARPPRRGWRSCAASAAASARRATARSRFGACSRLRLRHAEAFEVDQPADARRAHAGVDHDDVAAHAVADQVDRLLAATGGRSARRGRPGSRGTSSCRPRVRVGQAEAAPVGGDHVALAGPAHRPRTGTTRPRPSSRASSAAAGAAAWPSRRRPRRSGGACRPRRATNWLRPGRRGT